jgi:hypothetical protein
MYSLSIEISILDYEKKIVESASVHHVINSYTRNRKKSCQHHGQFIRHISFTLCLLLRCQALKGTVLRKSWRDVGTRH